MPDQPDQQPEFGPATVALMMILAESTEVVRIIAARASADAHNVPSLRQCLECHVVGHEPLQHHPDCLAVRCQKLLAMTRKAAQDVVANP